MSLKRSSRRAGHYDREWSQGAAGPLFADHDDDDRSALDGFDIPDWSDASLCSQSDPEAWFPEKGQSTAEAKAICRRCPVQDECLEYALENDEKFGVWGGKSEPERRRIQRERNGLAA